jgi:elongation factor Ts
VPASVIAREREIYQDQVKGKPENVVGKIVEGKLDKYFASVCLVDQPFIKDPDHTIKDLVSRKISELGENIVIRRFSRFVVGEDLGPQIS